MRRRTLLGAAAAAPAFGILRSRSVWAQGREIHMVEAGGRSGESVELGYIEPFTRKTGIKVVRQSPNPIGRLRAMVDANQHDTVLFELPSGAMRQAMTLGLLEPIDWARVDPEAMFSEARHEYGFGHQYFSTVMCWRNGVKEPKSWEDFFNVRDFPGPRALPNYPNLTLAFALLATGVQPDKLFPLDLDTAFKKLEEIKESVAVWWKSGESPPELMREGEIDYAIAWSGRMAGDPKIRFTFQNAMLNLSYFTVVKGASREDKLAAWRLMHEASLPENQAKAASVISYTGPSPDLEPLLPADRLVEFPTIKRNKDVQWLQDADWWEANGVATEDRWEDFIDNL
jgi:putative spermidine/putrescine transport system substrate-binding protein